jgi:dipeptide/tripeptide permease
MFILIVEMCERLCFYTIYPTIPEYLEHAGPGGVGMKQGPANALKQSFKMWAYVFPIVGGYLADNVLGRYRTILYFTMCYLVGNMMIATGSLEQLMTAESGIGKTIFLIGAIVFVAVGTGAIKPNVVNFGAEQYDERIPDEVEQQKAFFSYFYLTINVGSFVSSVWIVGLATSTTDAQGPGQGYFYAYLVAAIAMGLALATFILGTPFYSQESKSVPTKKPMVSIIRKHLFAGAGSSWQGKLSVIGWVTIPVYLLLFFADSLVGKDLTHWLSSGCNADGCNVSGVDILSILSFSMLFMSTGALCLAHKSNDWIPTIEDTRIGAITTEEVKGFMRTIPTIACVMVGFNICYGGMDIYPLQACQMDTRTGFPDWLNSFFFLKGQFNGNFFSLGDSAAIIICIPLFEKILFPWIKNMRGGQPLSRKTKYNVGFFMAILGCVMGIVIESVRKNAPLIPCDTTEADACFCYATSGPALPNVTTSAACHDHPDAQWVLVSQCAPTGVPMSDMNAWWTFIPFFITGIGEVLVNPVIQEFSFDEVSVTLKSLLMGFTTVVMGCIPAVISGATSGFIPNDLNKGKIDIVFILFIVLSIILLGGYHLIAIPDKVRTVGQTPAPLLEQEA